MAELRNVIVFALGSERFATELRWVREVATLGFVTEVPSAPPGISGVCNLHGAIVPVLDLPALRGGPPGPPARQGDGALVVELEGVVAALRVDQVDEVATFELNTNVSSDGGVVGAVLDRRGRRLGLIDPAILVRVAIASVSSIASGGSAAVNGGGITTSSNRPSNRDIRG